MVEHQTWIVPLSRMRG